ncbi:stage V sporulation protein AA [Alkaliphilus peptidifermentans DSM 18978]|uniref:Stage V sporulation protein AA n=2 Tax=Alkaliphilus TaxID=114627 RepID=A0A1G5JWF8_9FIRM|nr:stage V sporulation protein AA [Alkaliphilus peptidifermentans DSM 18978]
MKLRGEMMDTNKQIYIQTKGKVMVDRKKPVYLKELVEVYSEKDIEEEVDNLKYEDKILNKDKANIISVLSIIKLIRNRFPEATVTVLGDPEILLSFKTAEEGKDKYKILRLTIVTLLLFVGSITAIINFHSDVDMKQAHKTIYRIITGETNESPLLLQIPYSLGIGAGMSVFFNHVFKKRINTEPSPLEVEMYLYQQNMDDFIKNNDHYPDMKKKDVR